MFFKTPSKTLFCDHGCKIDHNKLNEVYFVKNKDNPKRSVKLCCGQQLIFVYENIEDCIRCENPDYLCDCCGFFLVGTKKQKATYPKFKIPTYPTFVPSDFITLHANETATQVLHQATNDMNNWLREDANVYRTET